MKVTIKLAAGAAAGVISLFGGLTAASALSGSVANGVTDTTGVSLPLAATSHRNPHASAAVTTATSATSGPNNGPSTNSIENHGACVSKVAQDKSTTGEAHGDAVSTVAKSDCGKPPHASNTSGRNSQSPASSNANHDATGDAASTSSPGDTHADANTPSPNAHADSGQAKAASHRP